MEHRKVLRISTIVLAMAIFSLVIAKPGMAYARSHFNPFDLPDVSSLHECGHHQLCGVAATGLKALDPTHGLLSGPFEKAGND
jgi:hypothetical protein